MSNQLKINNNLSFETAIYANFLLIVSLILPVILIPIINFFGYSEIIEEIAKALVVLFLILKFPTLKLQILGGIVFGFLFGVSENFLYLNQIFQFGNLSIFWQRFLWTVPMHIITILIMVFTATIKKWFLIFGLVGAIILHLLFNAIITNM